MWMAVGHIFSKVQSNRRAGIMREDPEGTVRSFPLNGPEVLVIVHCGGAGGGRTHYLFNAIEALSQLSYSPTVYGPGVRTGRP